MPLKPSYIISEGKTKSTRQPIGGSRKGRPNKASEELRHTIHLFIEGNLYKIDKWLMEVEKPERRIELLFLAMEYCLPKLGRIEHTGKDGADLTPIQMINYLLPDARGSNNNHTNTETAPVLAVPVRPGD